MAELDFMIWLHETLHPIQILTTIMKFITMLGDHGIIWLALGAVMLCFKRTRLPGFVMLVSLVLGFVLNDFILKGFFARPRPISQSEVLLEWQQSTGYPTPTGFSFPSGHSMATGACTLVLLHFYKNRAIFPTIVGYLIALSRIYMCAHFPTDVLAGILFGLIIAQACLLLYKPILNKFKRLISNYKLKRKFYVK